MQKERPQSQVWEDWENRVKQCLVEEMRAREVTYAKLSECLKDIGIQESPGRLNRKVNRKRFSAAFFLACCEAMRRKDASKPRNDE